jgi:hypothetical protein
MGSAQQDKRKKAKRKQNLISFDGCQSAWRYNPEHSNLLTHRENLRSYLMSFKCCYMIFIGV